MESPGIEEFVSVPFPKDVPFIELEKISLNKLLTGDEIVSRKVFEICSSTGFFYLNLMDHPEGRQLWQDACHACRVGQEELPNRSIEEKRSYKLRDRLGVYDKGYFLPFVAEDGRPRYAESFNIPQTELFSSEKTDFVLPPWLAKHEELFRAALRGGNTIANVVLSVLERALQLPSGSFTSLHRLTDPSSDFLRVLRYPGFVEGKTVDQIGFPAHKDAVSVAILFTWLGGLQIPRAGAKFLGPNIVAEEDWLWVKPLPGHAIVNLGDAMEILTNKVLKSGLHRVVKAPGAQAPHDKYSVLLAARPNNKALMKPFESPLIPKNPAGQAKGEVLTSEQWGSSKIKGLQEDLTAKANGRGV